MKSSSVFRAMSVITICAFLLSCEKISSTDPASHRSDLEQKNGSLVTPEPNFEVRIDFPNAAFKQFSDAGETIVLSASFADEIGPEGLYLGTLRAEIKTPGIIKISGVQFDKKIAKILPDKNYEVLINVYSGRKTDDRNLLDCDAPQGLINEFQGKTIVVKCQLGNWAMEPKKVIPPRFTGEMNGKEFKAACGKDEFQKAIDSNDKARTQFCIGFVRGIINAADSFVSSEDYNGDRLFCLPRHMSEMDYTILAIQRAEELGISDDARIGNTILGGLHSAFPCGR